jgi:hypothetical protein
MGGVAGWSFSKAKGGLALLYNFLLDGEILA